MVLPALSLAALAFAIFAVWMHLAVLDPTNVGWLIDGNDRGQSAIGLAAYLRGGGPWPSLHEPFLASPEGMTLLFTDSIPLLGLILGPGARWLPPALQFIGPWYLTCLLLHTRFAWGLARRYAPDALGGWLGAALLTLMPALINRYGHASLCAQWLVLWALWVFVDPDRSRRTFWWMAVLGIAALVHSYLLLMVAAIWGSAVLRDLVRGPDRGMTLLRTIPVLAVVATIAGLHGVVGQHFASTGTYGAFPMALDALWNPANPGYTALLPSSPDDHGRGFEGLQYLGAGLLALAVLAVVTLVRTTGDERQQDTLRRLRWLLPAFAVLALLAIGPQWLVRGSAVMTVHLPQAAIDALDPVRAAGRLFWPATYTIAFVAVITAYRLKRSSLILAAALVLQIVDLAPMLAAIHATSARADDHRSYSRTHDPRWDALIARASAVDFEPPEPFRDLGLMEEVAWRAIRLCRPVRYFYASRETPAVRARLDRDALAFRLGQIDPTRLYVLLGGAVPPSLSTRARHLDGVAIIPPSIRASVSIPGCR